ncbi:major vault protein [Strigomonas culicis]|uniref:Major vault protein n=1 Tax=Strigomonas culicis TaxID=28005 RepID=S9V8K2_9TRYP|nr:major vault protein [Strigomonas culicis]|eukprot:EPY37098.1 major vault protein [Strigomonas culicis]
MHPTTGVTHHLGELYLYTTPGLFFPEPQEELVRRVEPYVSDALGSCVVRVHRAFVDPRAFALGVRRQVNDEYLLTHDLCPSFLLHPYETIHDDSMYVKYISPEHFQVIERETGGRDVLSDTFYFRACSDVVLRHGYHKKYLLSTGQSVLAQALCDFVDETATDEHGHDVHRSSGDQWLIKGPGSVMPTKHYTIVHDARTGRCVRDAILLGECEGIYVRDKLTGVVRLVGGPASYMLQASEALWAKPVPPLVRALLLKQTQNHTVNVANRAVARTRGDNGLEQQTTLHYNTNCDDTDDPDTTVTSEDSESYTSEMPSSPCRPLDVEEESKAIVFHIPYRSVTQLYNYKSQTKRLIFGPARVILEPHEEFTIISLSGSPWDPAQPTKCLPKEPHRISALYLFLGPANMADVVHVETRDHAQLALQLGYDWFFDVPYGATGEAQKCFTVNDFVGDACSFIASSIRAAVALLPFEEFHRSSAKTLRDAVFGVDPATGLARSELRFPENRLVITSVDIQEMEVLDARTRQGLQKSVKMAIEITTYAQEADAQQVASAREQEASGRLGRQRMTDQVANEELRRVLLEAENRGLVYAHVGKSSAMGQAAARALQIEGEATTQAAAMRAERTSCFTAP